MKAEPRLDPVRRGWPAGSTLVRLAAVTMLLAVAAMFAWFGSSGCDPTAATADGQPSDRRPAAPSGEPDAQPLPNAGQGFAVVQRPG